MIPISCSTMVCSHNHLDTAVEISGYGERSRLRPDFPFPVTNLSDPAMHTFFQMKENLELIEPGEDFSLVYDLERTEAFKVVACMKTNLEPTSRWRIRISDELATLTSDPVYDSTWVECMPGLNQFGTAEWGTFDWGEFDFSVYMGSFNRQCVHVLPELILGRYIRIDWDVYETVNLYGHVQAARLWASDGYQPNASASYGSSVSFMNRVKSMVMESGVIKRGQRRISRRAVKLQFDNEEKLQLFYNMFGPVLSSPTAANECLVLVEPTDAESHAFQVVYGYLVGQEHTATHAYFRHMSTSVNVEESI